MKKICKNPECNKEFEAKTNRKEFCCRVCNGVYHYLPKKIGKIIKTCANPDCDKTFEVSGSVKSYHSKKCRRKAKEVRSIKKSGKIKEKPTTRICKRDGCDEVIDVSGPGRNRLYHNNECLKLDDTMKRKIKYDKNRKTVKCARDDCDVVFMPLNGKVYHNLECKTIVKNRKMKKKYHEKPRLPKMVVCAQDKCDVVFVSTNKKKFHSKECARLERRRVWKKRHIAKRTTKVCERDGCDIWFSSIGQERKYHSDECAHIVEMDAQRIKSKIKRKERIKIVTCARIGCDIQFEARDPRMIYHSSECRLASRHDKNVINWRESKVRDDYFNDISFLNHLNKENK